MPQLPHTAPSLGHPSSKRRETGCLTSTCKRYGHCSRIPTRHLDRWHWQAAADYGYSHSRTPDRATDIHAPRRASAHTQSSSESNLRCSNQTPCPKWWRSLRASLPAGHGFSPQLSKQARTRAGYSCWPLHWTDGSMLSYRYRKGESNVQLTPSQLKKARLNWC